GAVDPVGAAIVGHAEQPGVGDAAPAGLLGRLEQGVAFARRAKPPRGGDAGGAGPDDDGIDRAGARNLGRQRGWRLARRRQYRPRGGSGGGGKERAAAQTFHGRWRRSGVWRDLPRKPARTRQIFSVPLARSPCAGTDAPLPLRNGGPTMLDAAIKALAQM